MKNSVIPIFIPHLGCPNACVFCNQRAIASPHQPDAEDVVREIESGLKYAQKPQIAFYGGSFTAIDRDLMIAYLEAAHPFVRSGLADSIRISTRPDAISEEILDILEKYGVRTIELGSQSMVDRVLLASKRGHTAEDTKKASGLINRRGFELILQLMAGLPESSAEDDLYSAEQACLLSPFAVRIYPTCVISDTELCDMYESGTYEALTVEKAVAISADMMDIFDKHNIPVIRVGLNPTDDLSAGGVKAGAYHPAFGQLVSAERCLRICISALSDAPETGDVIISCPKGRLSDIRGQKNSNVRKLSEMHPGLRFAFKEDPDQSKNVMVRLNGIPL